MAKWYHHAFSSTPLAPFFWLDNFFGSMESSEQSDKMNDIFGSVLNKYTGAGLTSSEKEANQFSAEEAEKNRSFQERMSNTQYQRTVQDMKDAGLNPAVMLAGSGGAVSSPSGSTAQSVSPSGGSLTDLLSLVMLPLQMRQISAETRNIEANTALTNQKKLTEEQITALQSIAVQWQPNINAETLAQISASVDKIDAEIQNLVADKEVKRETKQLIHSQKEAQAIVNFYLPMEKISSIAKMDAEARASRAAAWFSEVQARFADDNGFLMSSNDSLLLATYIGSLLNLDKQGLNSAISKAENYIKSDFKYDFHPWRKVSPDEAMAYYLEHMKD